MRSPCAGDALEPPLWKVPTKALSLPPSGPRVPSGGVTLKRRCTYRPSVIYLIVAAIVNKLLSLSLSLPPSPPLPTPSVLGPCSQPRRNATASCAYSWAFKAYCFWFMPINPFFYALLILLFSSFIAAGPCLFMFPQRRCHLKEALYILTSSHLLVVNKLPSLSLSLSLSLLSRGRAQRPPHSLI